MNIDQPRPTESKSAEAPQLMLQHTNVWKAVLISPEILKWLLRRTLSPHSLRSHRGSSARPVYVTYTREALNKDVVTPQPYCGLTKAEYLRVNPVIDLFKSSGETHKQPGEWEALR